MVRYKKAKNILRYLQNGSCRCSLQQLKNARGVLAASATDADKNDTKGLRRK